MSRYDDLEDCRRQVERRLAGVSDGFRVGVTGVEGALAIAVISARPLDATRLPADLAAIGGFPLVLIGPDRSRRLWQAGGPLPAA